MSVEENKTIVRRIFEELNKGKAAVLEELFDANCVFHAAGIEDIRGTEGVKQRVNTAFSAFPDYRAKIDDVLAEGDKVMVRLTETGTHRGDLMGIAPTGKEVEAWGVVVVRIAGGKAVESWALGDRLGLLQKLGVIPSPD
jgi:predicted ester cyclase